MSGPIVPGGAHRRHNPLTGRWVLVSPQRLDRPWQGQLEPGGEAPLPAHDPACYLCPGAVRANGVRNPVYTGTWAFDNDYPALRPGPAAPVEPPAAGGLFRAEPEAGTCRVLCYSPRHDLTLARMSAAERRAVVELWVAQAEQLGARPEVNHVQLFENRGAMMGCSNPHPHGQAWAQATVPDEVALELRHQEGWHAAHGRTLLADYLRAEEGAGERLVLANATWAVVVPFWAVWPFETLLISRRPVAHLGALDDAEREGLAEVLGQLMRAYDALFATDCPWSLGVHQAPTDGAPYPAWHLHLHVHPPLLRSARVRKFLVGYEMFAMPQRDLLPEAAAARLRAAAAGQP